MKFEDYMIKEAFDKVGKQLKQIHQKIQKTQSCEGLQNVVLNAINTLKSVNKGMSANIELFFRDYTELIRKIGIDLSLNTLNAMQYIEMHVGDEKIKKEFRKINKDIRDNDFKLKILLTKNKNTKQDLEKLIEFFGKINDDINKVIKIKIKAMQ
jgi:uncharacterized coiled-coil DUF342 family protein